MSTSIRPDTMVADQARCDRRVQAIAAATGITVYPESVTPAGQIVCAIVRDGLQKSLLLLCEHESQTAEFIGQLRTLDTEGTRQRFKLCALTHENAVAVRTLLPFTAPTILGRVRSIGLGDRLGLATPGHVQAIRGSALRPVLAQQSIREMTRTGRSPSDVVDDATWGVLQTGFRDGFGADADHLKTTAELVACLRAGFTGYTVDLRDHVDDSVSQADPAELRTRFRSLPWQALRSTAGDCLSAYADRTFAVEGLRGGFPLVITTRDLLRAAVKFGRALVHTAEMYQYLAGQTAREQFEFEVSIDEAATATSLVEHFFIAAELRRMGVRCDGLAPRFVGEFCKGVEYVGSLPQFRADFARHVLIAQHCGPYKISVHSGSDKFSLYPIVAELGGDLIHVKTSGTSYLEALRAVAHIEPDLFREILALATERYADERASYHVQAEVARMPDPQRLTDEDLPGILDQPDTRQICHVTFGAVLGARGSDRSPSLRDRLLATLLEREDVYYSLLRDHFHRHLKPFE